MRRMRRTIEGKVPFFPQEGGLRDLGESIVVMSVVFAP
jgi:hypothetical protein